MEKKLPGHTYNFKTLLRVYIALLALAGGMVILSVLPLETLPLEWIDLHVLKGLAILGLSVIMIAITASFLMGLKYETSHLHRVVFMGNFAFLGLFILFVWADVTFRGLLDPAFEKQINWESPVIKVNEGGAADADDAILDESEDSDYRDEDEYEE